MSNRKRPTMLVLSGLFFNAQGNQSMYNSIKGYQKEYEVIILTVADLSSRTYLSVSAAKNSVPGVRVISLWPSRTINTMRKLFGKFKGGSRKQIASFNIESPLETFSNTPASRTTRIAFKVRSYILVASSLVCALIFRPSKICIYEINGLRAAVAIKRHFPKTVLFGKFQGTIIGPFVDRKDFEEIVAEFYPLEAWSMPFARYLDCAIMTNDGTNGAELLRRYGLNNESILFLPNGVDQRVLNERPRFQERRRQQRADPMLDHEQITVASVSRLANWKRVPKVISAVDDAITHGSKLHFIVVGGGSPDDVSCVEEAIRNSRNSSEIQFLGALDFEGVINKLLEVDVLISAFAKTNICNPTFEALALGIPVLTIEDERLVTIIGSKARACYFVTEAGDEDISTRLSMQLQSLRATDILERSEFLFTQPSHTWENRNDAELAYLRAIR